VTLGAWLVILAVVLPCAIVSACGLRVALAALRLTRLDRADAPDPQRWPRLSIVVPASNEAQTIEAALETLLRVDYPELEIIVVDDRSTDRTGEIILRLAAKDARITPVRIDQLPDGWLGKVHALRQGRAKATGEWLLFTDADVHFEGPILKRAVAYAGVKGIDHLVVLADPTSRSFWVNVAVSSFFYALMTMIRLQHIESDRKDAFIGSGAFNLVRGTAFDRTPGFEWLKMEIADDLALGMMVKGAGAKQSVVLSPGSVRVEWYPSVMEMVRGLEKNSFPVMARFSWLRFAGIMFLYTLATLAPFAAFLPLGISWLWIAGASVFAANTIGAFTLASRAGLKLLPLLLAPFGQFLLYFTFVHSAYKCGRSGGTTWRGTFYSAESVKAGARIKLWPS
jgi:cellulose synthase/poly-beta-1,6-N-acetylglucosamine synthase-like glycosyltransferase